MHKRLITNNIRSVPKGQLQIILQSWGMSWSLIFSVSMQCDWAVFKAITLSAMGSQRIFWIKRQLNTLSTILLLHILYILLMNILYKQEPSFWKCVGANQRINSSCVPPSEWRVHFLKVWYQAEEIVYHPLCCGQCHVGWPSPWFGQYRVHNHEPNLWPVCQADRHGCVQDYWSSAVFK